MIHFACPCGRTLDAYDENAGGQMPCPACGRILAIPRADEVPVTAQAVQTRPAESAPASDGGPASPAVPAQNQPGDAAPPANPLRLPDGIRQTQPTTSGLAVASAILGAASLGVGCLAGPLASIAAGAAAIVIGGLALAFVLSSKGQKKGAGLAVGGLVLGLIGGVAWPTAAYLVVEHAANLISSNNLKQIVLALHDYGDAYDGLPPAAVCDADGKPLLSWRVTILPYIEHQDLYRRFKMDEPWDSRNNIQLLELMPREYALPGDVDAKRGLTHYRVFVGEHAAFDLPGRPAVSRPIRLHGDFPDGMADTILVVEAREAVPWTKPDELTYDPQRPLPPLGGRFHGGFHAIMADGSVHWVSNGVSEPTLRAAITRDGGEVLGADW